uniref:Retrotransposon, putative, centromere-specific n=1 Tax=Oryza sativa subsp. japonica TaxID=39947 RepID=Q6UUB5_ORYSJ|nr:hypothetical protein OSJNBa0074N12.20 [Oryza sativa Japonica Group]
MAGLRTGKRDGHAQRQHLHHQRDIATSSRITYEVDHNHKEIPSHYDSSSLSMLRIFDRSDLQESNENTMTRFFRGLNSNIQAGLVNVTYNHIGQLFMLACNVERKILENPTEQQAMLVPPIIDVLQEVQNSPQNEKNDMFEMSLPSLMNEEKADAPTLSEEGIKGKLNVAEITQGEYASDELHFSTFHADLEQTLVEPTSELPLSQVDLHYVPCDKEELCDSTSFISIPQLVNEHATFNLDSPCTEFKYVIHMSSENDELQLQSSLNTLGYIMFDDSCELNCLKDKIFAHSDLPCSRNVIFHIFGEYNDLGIYFVHRVYICSDLKLPVHVDKTCKLEKNVIANQIVSSLPCFDWKKQIVVNGLRKEHHMEKPRTVFHAEGDDDVTMATTDATIAHIMDEQEDIKIKSSKCWNPIRPPATLLTSNGRQISIRAPFLAREYLMESSRSPLSNGSSLIVIFHLSEPQLKNQWAALSVMGLWAYNFIWDPGPGGAHVGNKVDLHRQDQQPTERCIDR